eukprot:COSAG02_NODE_71848_length_189_cov_35.111111_2_plen_33_part_01
MATAFGGRFFTRVYNQNTGEWNRQLNDVNICQP